MCSNTISQVICLFVAISMVLAAPKGTYREELQRWRAEYESSLKDDNGWLSLAGLFWLKEGDNPFGTSRGNVIVLPTGSAQEAAGNFRFHEGEIQLVANTGVNVLLNGKPVQSPATLKPDSSGNPDHITLGRLTVIVIRRGERYGIRLWDNGSPGRHEFVGVKWFPIKESYRVTARFTSYPQPKMIPILNILGDTEQNPSPGLATFQLAGKVCSLEPILEDDRLFFMFKDSTSAHETYPAGRFLYASLPKNGKVVLDFNQAHNPPCAFTSYATCPLPPKQNHLPVRIEAGELNYRHGH